jgi:cytochrome P450
LKSTGIDEIPFSYYDKMPLLTAAIKVCSDPPWTLVLVNLPSGIKETLRVHPVVFMGARQAVEDELIPLSQPLKLTNGRLITEIPVSKGQNVWINVPGYNRLPRVFGENVHDFNPDRWLDNKLDDLSGLVGVYSNLISFGHGPHACIGKHVPLTLSVPCMLTPRRVEI